MGLQAYSVFVRLIYNASNSEEEEHHDRSTVSD